MKRFLIYFSLNLSVLLAASPDALSAHVQNDWTGSLPAAQCQRAGTSDLNTHPAFMVFMIKAASSGAERQNTVVEDAEIEREEDEQSSSKKHVDFGYGTTISNFNARLNFFPSVEEGSVHFTHPPCILSNHSYLVYRVFRV